jgi:hypothetical protein
MEAEYRLPTYYLRRRYEMTELVIEREVDARPGALQAALREVRDWPSPSLVLPWRGRARVRALDSPIAAEIEQAEQGRSRLVCRRRVGGPLWRLVEDGSEARLRQDLRRFADAVCRRARALDSASDDGRPPPRASGPATG